MMKIFDELNNKNFRLFAANNYNNPECTDIDEFKQDLSRFKYLKRLLTRFDEHGELQERLILNHLIVLFNVFGIEPCKKMLMYKIDKNHYHIIKPFLHVHPILGFRVQRKVSRRLRPNDGSQQFQSPIGKI